MEAEKLDEHAFREIIRQCLLAILHKDDNLQKSEISAKIGMERENMESHE